MKTLVDILRMSQQILNEVFGTDFGRDPEDLLKILMIS